MSFPITKQIRQEKRAEAEARNVAYNKQSFEQKLGNAGKKERTKLTLNKGQSQE